MRRFNIIRAVLIAILLLGFVIYDAFAVYRDPAQVRAFRKLNACPATKQFTGPCPGYVVDHIIALCMGGPDHPRNMQWQTTLDSYRKDILEREVCRQLRKTCDNPTQQFGS